MKVGAGLVPAHRCSQRDYNRHGGFITKYDPDKHHRRSIRLKGYDYAQAGLYLVTICAQNRECRFGEIVNGEMVLNDAGRMAKSVWEAPMVPGLHWDM